MLMTHFRYLYFQIEKISTAEVKVESLRAASIFGNEGIGKSLIAKPCARSPCAAARTLADALQEPNC
ncbi:unnamed protein product [Arctogadus glacialis]